MICVVNESEGRQYLIDNRLHGNLQQDCLANIFLSPILAGTFTYGGAVVWDFLAKRHLGISTKCAQET